MYGFRIYTFTAHVRSRGKSIDLAVATAPSYRDRLVTVLTSMEQAIVLTGRPDWNTIDGELPSPPIKGDVQIVVSNVTATANRVACTVSYGHVGRHSDLLDVSGSTSIEDKAAGQRHRLVWYFPDHGDTGIFVCEVISNMHPSDTMFRWIGRADNALLAQGGLPPAPGNTWHKISIEQMGDPQHLEQLKKNGSIQHVRFTSREFSKTGRPTKTEALFEIRDFTGSRADALLTELGNWHKGKVKKAVEGALTAVGLNPKGLEKQNIAFNFAEVRLLQGNQAVTINPYTVEDLFTYPISQDIQPADTIWRHMTSAKASSLAATRGLPVQF